MSTGSPNPKLVNAPGVSGSLPAPAGGIDAETRSSEPRQTAFAATPAPNNQPLLPSIKFSKQLNAISQRAQSKAELIRNGAALLKSAGCMAMWIFTKDGDKRSQPISLLGDDAALIQVLGATILTAAELVESNQSLVSLEPQGVTGNIFLGAPIVCGEIVTEILVGLFPTTSRSQVPVDWAFKVASEAISTWQMHKYVQSTNHQLASLSGFVNMAAALNRTNNQLDAAITLVNELKKATNTAHVALMLRNANSHSYRLTAMSGVECFDPNSATTQTIESTVLGQDEEEAIFWSKSQPETQGEFSDGTPVNLRNFCSAFDAEGCALLPLQNSEKETYGWLLSTLSALQCNNPQVEKQFYQISALVAGQLETVLKSQRTLTRVCLDNTKQVLKKKVVRKISTILAIIGIVMCLPFSYRIPCDCELQLTSRRFVAAPYEGLLKKTLVVSGDIVKEGQTLARMDASQLRMQLSGIQANVQSERKKRDSALARGRVAESQIAKAEMSRLESELAIITNRLNDTEIRSPVDGVIVSGDLDKAEGAPMEMGQNLFEVGPLEKMLVEVQIPENEIQYAKPGMEVRFEFDAFPFETFQGQIERIHPRAEVIDSNSVFVAEVSLENSSGQLRPGLKGRAKIFGERSPLGWNLFHGAFEKARQWFIW